MSGAWEPAAGSRQQPLLLGKAREGQRESAGKPRAPGGARGCRAPCVLLCDLCARGLRACAGSWSHAGRRPGALGCDFASCPRASVSCPTLCGGRGHPPPRAPRWGLRGVGAGACAAPLWVSRLRDCPVSAADPAPGIRARPRGPSASVSRPCPAHHLRTCCSLSCPLVRAALPGPFASLSLPTPVHLR